MIFSFFLLHQWYLVWFNLVDRSPHTNQNFVTRVTRREEDWMRKEKHNEREFIVQVWKIQNSDILEELRNKDSNKLMFHIFSFKTIKINFSTYRKEILLSWSFNLISSNNFVFYFFFLHVISVPMINLYMNF